MAKSKADKHAEVFQQAHAELTAAVDACEDVREQCLQDRRFYSIAGAPWEGVFGKGFEDRPKLDINKSHLAVIRIINEYRNNRIDAVFTPRDGSTDDELSDACAGLYRADRQDSAGEEAQDNAFEEAVGGGFGAWRLTNEFEDEYDEDSDAQRIRFVPIYDADTTVFFDPGARLQDKSDARYCFVLCGMTRDAYIDQWGEEPTSMDRQIETTGFDWYGPDLVYVAEYYRCEETTETVYSYRDVSGNTTKYRQADFDRDPDLERRLSDVGTVKVMQRPVKAKRVRKYILSGAGVLEDCGHIAGTEIPIIPVYGKRWYVDGKEQCMGHVRTVKDAQRLANMLRSYLSELVSIGGIDTPILSPEQIQGHESEWAARAVKRQPYLLLNEEIDSAGNSTPSGPAAFLPAPSVPQALAALLQISEGDIEDLLGGQNEGEQIQSNLSGRAVELVQTRLDEQTRIYMTNFAKAIKRSGEVWLGMARDIYADESRTMKMINYQGKADSLDLSEKIIDDETGEPKPKVDLARAKLGVTVDIGPSSNSKRNATVQALTQMLPLVSDPMDQQVIAATAMMNMDGEGISDVREHFRKKLVNMGVFDPTEDDLEQMQQAAEGQEPSAEQQFIMAETAKAEAEAQRVMADIDKTVAETEETLAQAQERRATTAKTLDDLDREAAAFAMGQGSGTMPPQGMRETGSRT